MREGSAMKINTWIGSYKVRAFPWIDGALPWIGDKLIYFNVQYYKPGQSLAKPPAWDKTVYITDNDAGQRILRDFKESLSDYIAMMKIVDNTKVVLTF